MITVCCVCQKTKKAKGWRRSYLAKDAVVSHGYCQDCYANLQNKISAATKAHR